MEYTSSPTRERRKKRASIFVKFTLTISLCLLVTFIGIALILTGIQERALLQEKTSSTKMLTKQVADMSATPIKAFTFFALEENTIKLQSNPEILSVLIYDNTGKKLNPSGHERKQIKIAENYWLKQESSCFYSSPGGEKHEVGKVVMIFSLESIYHKVAHMRLAFIFIIISTVIIVDAVVIMMLRKMITEPLKRLTQAAEQLSSGDFNLAHVPSKGDEIGFLGNTFVETSQKLKESFAKIQEYNETLQKEIVERTRIEKVLEEERNLLRTLINTLPDFIYVKDTEGHLLLGNQQILESIGKTHIDEIIGKTDFDLFPQEFAQQFHANEQQIFESGKPIINQIEQNVNLSTGEMMWLSTTKVPFRDRDERIVGLVGMSRDITERRKEEEELLQLKKAVETMSLGVTITDLAGKIIYINPATASMHGYQVAELLGMDVRIFTPSQSARPISLERISEREGAIRESVNIRKDGNSFPVWLMSEIVRDAENKALAVVTSCEDITQRKQAEEELKRHRNHLEELVQERTAELISANEELAKTLENLQHTQSQLVETEKMAALGQLIAGVAHEINTPLGAIQASISNISHALDETVKQLPPLLQQLSPEELNEFLEFVNRALQDKAHLTSREERKLRRAVRQELETYGITHADSIADNLVDMGLYETLSPLIPLLQSPHHNAILQSAYNLSVQRHHSVNITTAVERASKIVFALKTYARYDSSGEMTEARITEGIDVVLTLYHNQLKHGIEVMKEYADIPPIRCYPDELNQVWTNLIHNAIQAMNSQGTLTILVSQADDSILVRIIDSGSGIPELIQERIFEPFFTTKAPGEGSGLGLDIVRKIIDKHQGRVEVESQPGKTRFSVWLPMLMAETSNRNTTYEKYNVDNVSNLP